MEEKNVYITDAEKEKAYERAVRYLSSSLTNSELIEESLDILQSLGDYKDAQALYVKFSAQNEAKKEETAALLQRRKTGRKIQALLVGLGFAAILLFILILVYALKLDLVR